MPITDQNASIFNYDLNAAAQAAAIAAANVNSTNRPNYGALAATDCNAQMQRDSNLNLVGNGVFNNAFNQNRQFVDYSNNVEEYSNEIIGLNVNNQLSLDMSKQQQNLQIQQEFDANMPQEASPNRHNSSVFFGGPYAPGAYSLPHQNNTNGVIGSTLMRSTSGGQANNGLYLKFNFLRIFLTTSKFFKMSMHLLL